MKLHTLLTTTVVALSIVAASSAANASLVGLPAPYAYTTESTVNSSVTNAGLPGQSSFSPKVFIPGATYKAGAVATGGVPAVMTVAKNIGSAEAYENYWFEITGPSNISNIPVTESGVVWAFANNINAGAYASATIDGVAGSSACAGAGTLTGCSNYTSTGTTFNSFTNNLSLSSNTPYEVTILAQAQAFGGPPPVGKFKGLAFADPFMSINTTFLELNPGFGLEFSPGITNSAVGAVPLPASFPLFAALIAGMAGFAHFGRQRRNLALVA